MTLACFALGGLIYGPFTPMTYALFQSATDSASLPTVLAARGAVIMVSTRSAPQSEAPSSERSARPRP